MKLQEINKVVYRKNLNVVTIALVASLVILSLLFGSGLIALFGEASTVSGEPTGNFQWNLLGVVLAVIISVGTLMQFKGSPFLAEVYYVWKLKALHNRIYRKLKKIKSAAKEHDVNALIILSFYYHSLKLVYQLDNNTLTLNTLDKDLTELEETINKHNLSACAEQFDVSMLEQY